MDCLVWEAGIHTRSICSEKQKEFWSVVGVWLNIPRLPGASELVDYLIFPSVDGGCNRYFTHARSWSYFFASFLLSDFFFTTTKLNF
jgi:hypothetical protein